MRSPTPHTILSDHCRRELDSAKPGSIAQAFYTGMQQILQAIPANANPAYDLPSPLMVDYVVSNLQRKAGSE